MDISQTNLFQSETSQVSLFETAAVTVEPVKLAARNTVGSRIVSTVSAGKANPESVKLVEIYTDGGCQPNPGPGGWGAVLIFNGQEKELYGFEPDTTNNRMELMGAIKALDALKFPCKVKLHSDSALLINAFTKNWIPGWQRKGWVNASKEPVKNRDLWERLIELSRAHHVEWIKVKGHAGIHYNERCDQLCAKAINEGKSRR